MKDEIQTLLDTTQQATSKVPTTHVKPNRVEAGKAIAERFGWQKRLRNKKIAEVIVANEQLRKALEEAKKVDDSQTNYLAIFSNYQE